MKRIHVVLMVLATMLFASGCIVHHPRQPRHRHYRSTPHRHHRTKVKVKHRRRCPPSHYWDGRACRHKGR